MVFMAVFAAGVSLAEPGDRWRALLALAFGGAMAAGLAVAEGVGARGLDPALAAFREMPFNVAGVRRATAGSEYPNLGAACIAYGMLAATAAAAARGWRARTALVAVPFSLALLYTYSRGALVALVVGLLAAAATAGARRVRMAPLVSLGVLGLTAATFMSGREVFQLRLASEGLDAWYGARYEPVESALSLAPGAATMTAVKVTNTGRKAWTEEGQFHLSYHWYDVERHVVMDGGRTRLPRAMGPGDSAVLTAEVRAPGRPGSYLLLWDMVQEHTSWFSGQGVRPAAVRVRVGETSPAPTAVPAAPETSGLGWRPGRGELWSLAVRMWRAHPVLGVGPDRFRHLYGPWAGRAWWDDRVYANNLLLELAATVGTTGAALLAAALVAAAVRAWRARLDAAAQPEAIAIVSLLAFVAAHGMVDYVLAFTGHYLVLAFALGAASGLGPRT
jgi:O-antigen ligase